MLSGAADVPDAATGIFGFPVLSRVVTEAYSTSDVELMATEVGRQWRWQ